MRDWATTRTAKNRICPTKRNSGHADLVGTTDRANQDKPALADKPDKNEKMHACQKIDKAGKE